MSFILIFLVIIVLWAVVTYNRFIVLRGRVDNAWGDRNLMCTCGSPEEYEQFSK